MFSVCSRLYRCQVIREARDVRIFDVRFNDAVTPRRVVFGRSACFEGG